MRQVMRAALPGRVQAFHMGDLPIICSKTAFFLILSPVICFLTNLLISWLILHNLANLIKK